MAEPGGAIGPEELSARLEQDDFLLLDVRTEGEIAIASIPNAVNIPLDELPNRIEELSAWKNKDVAVMCHHGMRSAMAQGFLENNGFTNVRNVTGGIDAYAREMDASIPLY